MARYPLAYRWWTVPIAAGIGLWPHLTYAEVTDGRFRFRFGLWFGLEAPLDAIDSAEEVADAKNATIPAAVRRSDSFSAISLRTGPGPAVRIRFREAQGGRWLIVPKLPLPSFFSRVAFDQIEFNAADPAAVVAALKG